MFEINQCRLRALELAYTVDVTANQRSASFTCPRKQVTNLETTFRRARVLSCLRTF